MLRFISFLLTAATLTFVAAGPSWAIDQNDLIGTWTGKYEATAKYSGKIYTSEVRLEVKKGTNGDLAGDGILVQDTFRWGNVVQIKDNEILIKYDGKLRSFWLKDGKLVSTFEGDAFNDTWKMNFTLSRSS